VAFTAFEHGMVLDTVTLDKAACGIMSASRWSGLGRTKIPTINYFKQ